MIHIPDFETKKELYKFLHDNQDTIITAKKNEFKRADGFAYIKSINKSGELIDVKREITPIDPSIIENLAVTAIINTTNIMDSHDDVHIPGLWNKSLSENKNIKHLREHEMEFDYIISDKQDLKAYVKYFNWSDLGYDYLGITQALVFESLVRKNRNPFMLNQYANGWVDNHSVGMRYVKLGFAMNDPDYPNEFDAWNKYYPEIVNKDRPDERGYFFYVLEAKVIEGSAVPIGSNQATPTYSINSKEFNELKNEIKSLKELLEPQIEPVKSTQSKSTHIEFLKLIKSKI